MKMIKIKHMAPKTQPYVITQYRKKGRRKAMTLRGTKVKKKNPAHANLTSKKFVLIIQKMIYAFFPVRDIMPDGKWNVDLINETHRK